VETEPLEPLDARDVSRSRDRDAFPEALIVTLADLEAELVDPLREGHAVFALSGGDGTQDLFNGGVRRGRGPRPQVLLGPRLVEGDGVQETQTGRLFGHDGPSRDVRSLQRLDLDEGGQQHRTVPRDKWERCSTAATLPRKLTHPGPSARLEGVERGRT
jgi:hypothetical protein